MQEKLFGRPRADNQRNGSARLSTIGMINAASSLGIDPGDAKAKRVTECEVSQQFTHEKRKHECLRDVVTVENNVDA